MTSPKFQHLLREVHAVFLKDELRTTVCDLVLQRIVRANAKLVTLNMVAEQLGWHEQGQLRAIVDALDFLCVGSCAVLRRRYDYFPDTDEVLGNPVEIAPEQVEAALVDGYFEIPYSGVRDPQFRQHIKVSYLATEFAQHIVD